jgi:hypothetical protein
MSLSADDDFLNTIAYQARVAYATQQLQSCQQALQHWQARVTPELGASDRARAQDELAYYAQQVERWQSYLRSLGEEPGVGCSACALEEADCC